MFDWSVVDDYIGLYMREFRIPGLALVVVQDDRIVYKRGYGIADPSGRPVTPQTPFFLGSTSKSFTALAVLQLVEAGKINLDEPVQTYLPWFSIKDGAGGENAAARITVRHLLNQTSGIPTMTGESSLAIDNRSPDALEQQVRSFARASLVHVPGSAFLYANANYQIAGLIVQTVSGESLEDYVQQHIFIPLNMEHSYISPDDAQKHGLATGYRYWFGFPLPLSLPNLPYPRGSFPSGFYISSAEDLGQYLIAIMNGGRFQNVSILSPDGIALLHRPVLGNYAMGWNVQPGAINHNGAISCFGSQLYIDTVNNRGIAVLFNINRSLSNGQFYVAAESVANLVYGKLPLKAPPDYTYRNLLILALTCMGLELVWFGWSLLRMWRWTHAVQQMPSGRLLLLFFMLPLVIEVGLSLLLLSNYLIQGQTTFKTSFLYQPDLTLLSVLLLILWVGWCFLRTGWGIGLGVIRRLR